MIIFLVEVLLLEVHFWVIDEQVRDSNDKARTRQIVGEVEAFWEPTPTHTHHNALVFCGNLRLVEFVLMFRALRILVLFKDLGSLEVKPLRFELGGAFLDVGVGCKKHQDSALNALW